MPSWDFAFSVGAIKDRCEADVHLNLSFVHSFLVFLECYYHIMFLPHFDVFCNILLSTEQTHGDMKSIYFINIKEIRKNDIHILAG